jgi:P27 family predicted phage terminase small subunit
MRKPSWLPVRAEKYWDEYAPRCAEDQANQLAQLCDQLLTYEDAVELIERDGIVGETNVGNKQAHPATKIKIDAMKQIRLLLRDLGISEAVKEVDELEDFLT